MIVAEWLDLFDRVKRNGTHWVARCPAHDDRRPSLSIAEGRDGETLLHCFAGCLTEAVVAAVGRTVADLFPSRNGGDDWTPHGPAVARYRYVDEQGRLLFEVCRTADKSFPQRRPDPSSSSGWRWNLDGVRRVLYRLPEGARPDLGVADEFLVICRSLARTDP